MPPKKQASSAASSNQPLVVVVTPTYNRRQWFPLAKHCFLHQTYPQARLQWVVVDDSDEGQTVEDLVMGMPNVIYKRLPEKVKLGHKRNLCLDLAVAAKADIIAFQDDDDYYPPTRIAAAVRKLTGMPHINIVGSSVMYIYFCADGKTTSVGPYGPYHATAGTWVFKTRLLDEGRRFNEEAEKAEEKEFLRSYTTPLSQMNPWETILVISHASNTVDKYQLRQTPERCLMKESGVSLKSFLQKDKWAIKFIQEQTELVQAKMAAAAPAIEPKTESPMVDAAGACN